MALGKPRGRTNPLNPLSPARRALQPAKVMLAVRVLPEQKAFLVQLGEGCLAIGFDRAVAVAAAHAREASEARA